MYFIYVSDNIHELPTWIPPNSAVFWHSLLCLQFVGSTADRDFATVYHPPPPGLRSHVLENGYCLEGWIQFTMSMPCHFLLVGTAGRSFEKGTMIFIRVCKMPRPWKPLADSTSCGDLDEAHRSQIKHQRFNSNSKKLPVLPTNQSLLHVDYQGRPGKLTPKQKAKDPSKPKKCLSGTVTCSAISKEKG